MKLRAYPEYKDSGVEWIGEIPEGWKVGKIKHFSENLDGKRVPISAENRIEGKIPYYGATGVVDYVKEHIFNEELLLIGEDGAPFFDSKKDVAFIISGKNWVNNHAHVLRVNKKFNIKMIMHILNQVDYSLYIKGSTRDKLNQDQLKEIPVLIPLIEEQKAIISFLDKKTSEIDKTIEKDTRLIELLQEKRTALINHVVTKGLDPEAPMKDSGIEWIGKIPTHWKVKKAKTLFSEVNNRSKGNNKELLSVSHITGVTPRSEKPDITMFMAETTEGYKLCEVEDLVINTMWAWMGALGFSNHDGIVSPSYNVYRFKKSCLKSDYYDALFRTPNFVSEVTRWSKGIWTSRLRLYPAGFFQINLPVPPENEQLEIGNFIIQEKEKIDRLESTITKAISLLQEYKKSLIHHVVTGKVDVRDAV